ncbi:TPR domain containing hypothetical protein [Phytophthora palmivora]|uniref:Tc1-like transposase DDE domain-containing protein n=1 Tax=Phytophthora palmivora TaxID=4796 RepID=A0A2P4YS05_9STRA|nr:TPR domain containing hypothetical protein [Phytophthora palmivora]
MRYWYVYPEPLVYVDETSNNGLNSVRKYAWAKCGEHAIVRVPFARGERVSILAACDVSGFVAWCTPRGTFTQLALHRTLLRPLPRSIVVLDNACIHMQRALEPASVARGAVLDVLPRYCSQFNPIEIMFGQLKRWLARHANLTFALYPEKVLVVAMRARVKSEDIGKVMQDTTVESVAKHMNNNLRGLSTYEESGAEVEEWVE